MTLHNRYCTCKYRKACQIQNLYYNRYVIYFKRFRGIVGSFDITFHSLCELASTFTTALHFQCCHINFNTPNQVQF